MTSLNAAAQTVSSPDAPQAGRPGNTSGDLPPQRARGMIGRRDRGRWFNPTVRAQVTELHHQQHMSITAIAQRLGCSDSTVWTLLRGRPPRHTRPPLDPVQVQRYRDGEVGIRDIAAAVGCSLRLARVLLADAGVDVPADDDERLHREIVTRYTEQKQSIRAIAADVGRSYGYVHRCLTDAEVTRRPRSGTRPPRRTSSATPQPDLDASPPTTPGGITDDTH